MLVGDIDVADGLVNGSTGIVLDIIHEKNGLPPSLPKCIVVKFDYPFCGAMTRQASNIPLSCMQMKLCLANRSQTCGKKRIIARNNQNSNIPGFVFACTIHKVQGSTLQNVVLSTANIRTPRMMYVALSRVTNIEGLYLLDFHENSIKVSEATKGEMKRLQTDMKLKTVKNLLQEQNPKPIAYLVAPQSITAA